MKEKMKKERLVLEIMFVIVTIGMTFLLFRMGGYKMVVLNLFYLPIVLSGYYLGRTHAGVLALFCVLAVTIVTTLDASAFATFNSPVMIGLALTVWAAVLGLTAILVGTLCDERAKTVEELHVAYVGVVEVLSKYLQSANPKVQDRSTRIAQLSQSVAEEMKLSRKEIDDIRVGALLYDLGNVEITTQLITKAVDTLETNPARTDSYTFSGTDLVHSLGTVLSGALPMVLNQDDAILECVNTQAGVANSEIPLGAKIIRAVRAYDARTSSDSHLPAVEPYEAVKLIRCDVTGGFDIDVLDALEHCVCDTKRASVPEPTLV